MQPGYSAAFKILRLLPLDFPPRFAASLTFCLVLSLIEVGIVAALPYLIRETESPPLVVVISDSCSIYKRASLGRWRQVNAPLLIQAKLAYDERAVGQPREQHAADRVKGGADASCIAHAKPAHLSGEVHDCGPVAKENSFFFSL